MDFCAAALPMGDSGETRERELDYKSHPSNPRSNIAKYGAYDPDKYAITRVSPTVAVDEALIPNRPPCLTQKAIGMYLKPLTRELDEIPPCPTIDELPDSVINSMVNKEKAFWVDKPGANAYTLHDAYRDYGMMTMIVKPTPQAVFPRSYQYDNDCVKYRRHTACAAMKNTSGNEDTQDTKPPSAHCHDCSNQETRPLTPFQLAWAVDAGQKRWRNYPDLNTPLSLNDVRSMMMFEVGRPFQHEACNWYNENYPSQKYDIIIRKFSQ